MAIIGIDLGTSNSAAAVLRGCRQSGTQCGGTKCHRSQPIATIHEKPPFRKWNWRPFSYRMYRVC